MHVAHVTELVQRKLELTPQMFFTLEAGHGKTRDMGPVQYYVGKPTLYGHSHYKGVFHGQPIVEWETWEAAEQDVEELRLLLGKQFKCLIRRHVVA